MEAYVCLGSNSADAALMLGRALRAIGEIAGVKVAAASPVYLTEPRDYANQPWFHNQVLKLEVDAGIGPVALLAELLSTEESLGRLRDPRLPRFGPRKIDIDLLLFESIHMDIPRCQLPHPRMRERAFALVPLLDLSPGLMVDGKPLGECLARLNWRVEGNRIFQW